MPWLWEGDGPNPELKHDEAKAKEEEQQDPNYWEQTGQYYNDISPQSKDLTRRAKAYMMDKNRQQTKALLSFYRPFLEFLFEPNNKYPQLYDDLWLLVMSYLSCHVKHYYDIRNHHRFKSEYDLIPQCREFQERMHLLSTFEWIDYETRHSDTFFRIHSEYGFKFTEGPYELFLDRIPDTAHCLSKTYDHTTIHVFIDGDNFFQFHHDMLIRFYLRQCVQLDIELFHNTCLLRYNIIYKQFKVQKMIIDHDYFKLDAVWLTYMVNMMIREDPSVSTLQRIQKKIQHWLYQKHPRLHKLSKGFYQELAKKIKEMQPVHKSNPQYYHLRPMWQRMTEYDAQCDISLTVLALI
jgi:hypothetical protein